MLGTFPVIATPDFTAELAAITPMYGTDTSGMLDATGQEAGDVNAQVNANNSGWFQNTMNYMKTAASVAGAAGGG
jgi:hypothetical protein